MLLFSRRSDFFRDLQQEILEVPWRNLAAGKKGFEDRVLQFVARKVMAGVKIDADMSSGFKWQIKNFVWEVAENQKNEVQKKFVEDMCHHTEAIWEDHQQLMGDQHKLVWQA